VRKEERLSLNKMRKLVRMKNVKKKRKNKISKMKLQKENKN